MNGDDRWAIVDEPTPAASSDDLPGEVIDRRRVRAIALERRAHARRVAWSFALTIVFMLASVDCVWRLAARPMGMWQRIAIGVSAGFSGWMSYAGLRRWRSAVRTPPLPCVGMNAMPDFATLSDGRQTVAQLEFMTGEGPPR